MLSVVNKPFMLSVIMLSVIMLNFIIMNFIMLNVIVLSVVMLYIMAPCHLLSLLFCQPRVNLNIPEAELVSNLDLEYCC
jgi:hypothetical protein